VRKSISSVPKKMKCKKAIALAINSQVAAMFKEKTEATKAEAGIGHDVNACTISLVKEQMDKVATIGRTTTFSSPKATPGSSFLNHLQSTPTGSNNRTPNKAKKAIKEGNKLLLRMILKKATER